MLQWLRSLISNERWLETEDASETDLLASLGHTGRRVVLSHTLNTLWQVITKTLSHKLLSKFVILNWASFIAFLGCLLPAGRGLGTPVCGKETERWRCVTVLLWWKVFRGEEVEEKVDEAAEVEGEEGRGKECRWTRNTSSSFVAYAGVKVRARSDLSRYQGKRDGKRGHGGCCLALWPVGCVCTCVCACTFLRTMHMRGVQSFLLGLFSGKGAKQSSLHFAPWSPHSGFHLLKEKGIIGPHDHLQGTATRLSCEMLSPLSVLCFQTPPGLLVNLHKTSAC